MSNKSKRWVQERVVEATPEATPEETFTCWSDAESMRAWMCPGEIDSASADLDFRVGGGYRITMHGEQDYVQHDELPDSDTYAGHDNGWADILEKLAAHVAGRRDTTAKEKGA